MGSSVLGVSYGAGYMWGVVCYGYPMEQGTCGEYCVRGALWSRVLVGSSVLGVPYGAGYLWGVVC